MAERFRFLTEIRVVAGGLVADVQRISCFRPEKIGLTFDFRRSLMGFRDIFPSFPDLPAVVRSDPVTFRNGSRTPYPPQHDRKPRLIGNTFRYITIFFARVSEFIAEMPVPADDQQHHPDTDEAPDRRQYGIHPRRRRPIGIIRTPVKEILPQRTAFWSARMGLSPTQIRITSARRRFGSCSSEGHICYSWRLMQYPPEAIDYVIVHELAHLKHMNHSPAFYALVAKYLPDHKARRALLKK